MVIKEDQRKRHYCEMSDTDSSSVTQCTKILKRVLIIKIRLLCNLVILRLSLEASLLNHFELFF